MKEILFSVALACVLGSVARADEMKADHPCHKVKTACEAAGYKVGLHKEKKGLFKDCVKPIMDGQAVTGITIPAADLDACRAHHKNKKK